MSGRPVRLCLFIAVVLSLIASSSSGASGAPPGVTTQWPVDVVGILDVEAATGTALLRPEALGLTRLRAEAVIVETAWEKGVIFRSGTSEVANHVADEGRDRTVLRGADMVFDLLPGHAASTFLVMAERPVQLVAQTVGGASFVPSMDDALVQVGPSPEQIRASGRDSPRFWYTVETPVVEARTSGTLFVDGTFDLFVNDMELRASTADGKTWSDWTGYQEADPGAAATEYELRVTTLEVRNGTFTATSEDLGLYVPVLKATVDGTILAARVNGRLVKDDKVMIFQDDPLHLTGRGDIAMSVEGPRLALAPSGAFDVRGARTVEAPDDPDEGRLPLAAILGSIGGVALMATAGSMVVGAIPAPTARLRRKQYEHWLETGRMAAADGEMQRACTCFRRATRIDHDGMMAWFEWAHTALAQGDGETADRLAQRAGQVPGVDPLDILDLRASAAWERGDRDAFATHIGKLAAASPAMAYGLMSDLGIDPTEFDLAQPKQADRGLDGYA